MRANGTASAALSGAWPRRRRAAAVLYRKFLRASAAKRDASPATNTRRLTRNLRRFRLPGFKLPVLGLH